MRSYAWFSRMSMCQVFRVYVGACMGINNEGNNTIGQFTALNVSYKVIGQSV